MRCVGFGCVSGLDLPNVALGLPKLLLFELLVFVLDAAFDVFEAVEQVLQVLFVERVRLRGWVLPAAFFPLLRVVATTVLFTIGIELLFDVVEFGQWEPEDTSDTGHVLEAVADGSLGTENEDLKAQLLAFFRQFDICPPDFCAGRPEKVVADQQCFDCVMVHGTLDGHAAVAHLGILCSQRLKEKVKQLSFGREAHLLDLLLYHLIAHDCLKRLLVSVG